MSLFQVQPRYIRFIDPAPAPDSFPTELVFHAWLGPPDAFGCKGEPRTTLPRAEPCQIGWNANDGSTHIKGNYMSSLDRVYDLADGCSLTFCGDRATLRTQTGSLEEASLLMASVCQALIPMISYHFRVAVWIREAHGTLAEARFRYEVNSFHAILVTATKEGQQQRLLDAIEVWKRLGPQHVRFVSALYYYRHALRLSQIEPGKEHFIAEVILNLAKAIEVLFSDDRDRLREECTKLAISARFVEDCIVRIELLRSKVDVAHVALAPLSQRERDSVGLFMQDALASVHELLEIVEQQLSEGRYQLAETSLQNVERKKLLNEICQYADARRKDAKPKPMKLIDGSDYARAESPTLATAHHWTSSPIIDRTKETEEGE